MRWHGICLDERQRLQDMVKASCAAASGDGGCFVSKAVDCRAQDCRFKRAVLCMTNYGCQREPLWLIHQ
jgi:hypothetical protein